jgi:hypothetical protein
MTALKTTTRITKTPRLSSRRITPSFNVVRDRQTTSIREKQPPVFIKRKAQKGRN